ncbi:PLD nuclease N-terminal domain-containing protein [Kineococcus rhizosphaerae]|uniref:Phospholipase D-like protein n=1 Tax=Kineococcus rhizosphaerae TaxID=559628 RepID=A0A2T0R5A1_9ACTN|nr:PLD nuclease N-terminal domain-containing protein [Kineococcus rhizosphaerae]PRY15952.1 phospholipase D-like protein [Kineococcus rhizosphaerae]
MVRILPTLLVLALTVWCLVSLVQAPEGSVRNLPRWAWILLVLFFPLAGGIAYVLAGRPVEGYGPGPRRPRQAPRGPDDDEEFLRGL